MKYLLFCGLLSFLLPARMSAQQADTEASLPFDQQASFVGEVQILAQAKEGLTSDNPAGQFRTVSQAYARRMNIPPSTKSALRPVILQQQGKCYQFVCSKGQRACQDCILHWLDRNQDGRIQPRNELRCFCDTQKICRIRIRKVSCQ